MAMRWSASLAIGAVLGRFTSAVAASARPSNLPWCATS
jgi:hypothetical protein